MESKRKWAGASALTVTVWNPSTRMKVVGIRALAVTVTVEAASVAV